MGVKGLFQFLKRFEKGVYIPEYLLHKTVGIDIFWYIHQSKGDMFKLQNYLLPIIKNSKCVCCVFDGREMPEEKMDTLLYQDKKRNEILISIEQIEKFLKYPFNCLKNDDRRIVRDYLNQLKRQAWQPSPEYVDYVKNWLKEKDCEIYQAVGEADDVLIRLENMGIVDVIITNDSDLLILGSKNILRPICPLRGAVFNKDSISKTLGFTNQQWHDFMYLCKNMKENDICLAYSLISVYKELDYIYQKYDPFTLTDNLKYNITI